MTRSDELTTTPPHPVACHCRGNASDLDCPTRWAGQIGATNCPRTRPHRGHAWTGIHPMTPSRGDVSMRCRGIPLLQTTARARRMLLGASCLGVVAQLLGEGRHLGTAALLLVVGTWNIARAQR